jgi:hypothetical protein
MQGAKKCAGEADPFHSLFGWLAHVSGRLWIRSKMTTDVVTCSFCGAPSDRPGVDKVVAGPNVFICSSCVDLAAAGFATSDVDSPGACGFCSSVVSAGLYKRLAGMICRECLDICLAVIKDSRTEPAFWE